LTKLADLFVFKLAAVLHVGVEYLSGFGHWSYHRCARHEYRSCLFPGEHLPSCLERRSRRHGLHDRPVFNVVPERLLTTDPNDSTRYPHLLPVCQNPQSVCRCNASMRRSVKRFSSLRGLRARGSRGDLLYQSVTISRAHKLRRNMLCFCSNACKHCRCRRQQRPSACVLCSVSLSALAFTVQNPSNTGVQGLSTFLDQQIQHTSLRRSQ
jgi:hypothetical protein